MNPFTFYGSLMKPTEKQLPALTAKVLEEAAAIQSARQGGTLLPNAGGVMLDAATKPDWQLAQQTERLKALMQNAGRKANEPMSTRVGDLQQNLGAQNMKVLPNNGGIMYDLPKENPFISKSPAPRPGVSEVAKRNDSWMSDKVGQFGRELGALGAVGAGLGIGNDYFGRYVDALANLNEDPNNSRAWNAVGTVVGAPAEGIKWGADALRGAYDYLFVPPNKSNMFPQQAAPQQTAPSQQMLLPPQLSKDADQSMFNGAGTPAGATLPPPDFIGTGMPMNTNSTGPQFSMGTQNQLPTVPQQELPVGADYTDMQQWLEQAKPQPYKQADGKENLANILTQMGLGLMNAQGDWSTGLLGMGVGAMNAAKENRAQTRKIEGMNSDQNQKYALQRAEASGQMSERRARDLNAVSAVKFDNAKLVYNQELARAEAAQPKVLNASSYGITYQMVDPQTGQIKVFTQDTGLADKLMQTKLVMKGLGADSGAVDLASTKLTINENSPVAPFMKMGTDLVMDGTLQYVASPELLNELETQAMQSAAVLGLSGEQAVAQANRAKISALSALLMQNPQMMQQAMKVTGYGFDQAQPTR